MVLDKENKHTVYNDDEEKVNVNVCFANKNVCYTAVNTELEGTPFKVAYRIRNEFLLYVMNNMLYNKDKDGNELEQNFVIARTLDEITSMKILFRIEGDETKVSKTFLTSLEEVIKKFLPEISVENSVSLKNSQK